RVVWTMSSVSTKSYLHGLCSVPHSYFHSLLLPHSYPMSSPHAQGVFTADPLSHTHTHTHTHPHTHTHTHTRTHTHTHTHTHTDPHTRPLSRSRRVGFQTQAGACRQ